MTLFLVFSVALFICEYLPLDVIEEHFFLWIVVGRNTHDQLVEKQAKEVPVDRSWVSLFGQNLRG